MKKTAILSLVILSLSISAIAQNVEGTSGSNPNDPKLKWWKEAKFGMFIHWGLYAVPAGKWGDKTNYGEWLMHNAKITRAGLLLENDKEPPAVSELILFRAE
jgi:alpha-L-fucosidase